MPIPTSLLTLVLAGIDAMSIASGYHFDYGPANVMRPAARTYPQDFVTAREEAYQGVQMAGKNTQVITLSFRVLVPKGAGAAQDEVEKVKADHLRLMESLDPALRAAGGYLYANPATATWTPRLSRAIPAEVTVVFPLTYRQDRANPDSP